MPTIRELAKICKSKNAGPFAITIDIVFDSAEMFEKVRGTGILTAALFAGLYRVGESEVLFTEYPPGNAFKATLPREVPSGDIGDTDVYGAQQHVPVLDVAIPIEG